MDRERVRTEALILEKTYPSVKYDLENGYVMITWFEYPAGWKPETAPLFFDIPENYPRERPDVYIPPDLRYKGETAWAQHDRNDEGWWKWCIPRMQWEPDSHTLTTMVDIMRVTLSQPNERNPYWRGVQNRGRKRFQERVDDIVGGDRRVGEDGEAADG